AVHIPGTTRANESMLAGPVIFEDRLIGVIVNVKVGINQYTGDHLRLLTILANQAAVAIFNAGLIERLAASARTDPLTGLANRRAFEEALDERLAPDSRESFAILMLDVDGLKQVNDARGHAAGDAVLKRVASVISGDLREADLATRWGGDEFVLLVPGTDSVGAVSLARRIGGTLLNPDDPAGAVSVSIGTAAGGSQEFKLGIGGPYTGPVAKTGAEFKGAATLALEKVNYKIGDYKITPVWVDEASKPDKASSALEEAIVSKGIGMGCLNWHSSDAVAMM